MVKNQLYFLIYKKNFSGELNEHELNYLQYSADGKLKELKEVFEQQTYYLYTLNVNCVDSLDRTALSLATLNRHIEIVKFLLSEEIGESKSHFFGLKNLKQKTITCSYS